MNKDLKSILANLFKYIKDKLQIKETPKLILVNDKNNSDKGIEGLTGYYDNKSKIIKLYINGRSNSDICKTFAHELVHVKQAEDGKLNRETKPHYAQEDKQLRECEGYAYLWGGLLYRDFQDEQRMGPPKVNPTYPKITI